MFLWTAMTGWMATFLFGAGTSIPYVLKASRPAARAYGLRLRPHYWLGFLIPAISFLHAWLPMSAGRISGFDQTGLLLATAALVVMLWQLTLGVTLRSATGVERESSRRWHFRTMVLICSLVIAHIVLNRA
jgi:hypothetical protein